MSSTVYKKILTYNGGDKTFLSFSKKTLRLVIIPSIVSCSYLLNKSIHKASKLFSSVNNPTIIES
jgi:hypothetical protein